MPWPGTPVPSREGWEPRVGGVGTEGTQSAERVSTVFSWARFGAPLPLGVLLLPEQETSKDPTDGEVEMGLTSSRHCSSTHCLLRPVYPLS